MATETERQSPLRETVATTPTDVWNDSCSIEELTYAIEHGAVGATSNPTIVGEVLGKEMDAWRGRIVELAETNPAWTEDDVTWRLIEEMAVNASKLLLPVFEREGGRKGRLSIQTNPKFYRDPARITEQGIRFGGLAPNMQVKIPATRGVSRRSRRSPRVASTSTRRSRSPCRRRSPSPRRWSAGSSGEPPPERTSSR